MMRTEVVEYKDGTLDVRLTVSEATLLLGLRRTRLKVEASHGETDLDRRILLFVTYPDLVAATIEAEGIPWPPDFEAFIALPEPLAIAWEEAVYRLNPHWLPRPADTGEKKATQTTSTGD
jgi:hypothetical protein